jgi:hypothetical protein
MKKGVTKSLADGKIASPAASRPDQWLSEKPHSGFSRARADTAREIGIEGDEIRSGRIDG